VASEDRGIRVEPATEEQLAALVDGDDVFADRFGVEVVEGWAGFPEAVAPTLDAVRVSGPSAWGSHLFFDGTDGALVGFGGWKGEPVDGAAELGYAVAPARQGRGLATAVVQELLDRASRSGLRTAVAHTLAEANASTAVLTRCGFERVAELLEEGGGPVWRWERTLA
jgi:ribosomal-protein-alanine N-acetyltransferase